MRSNWLAGKTEDHCHGCGWATDKGAINSSESHTFHQKIHVRFNKKHRRQLKMTPVFYDQPYSIIRLACPIACRALTLQFHAHRSS
jgi:hypothetical protein